MRTALRSRFAVGFAVAALLISLAPPFPQPAAAATFTVQVTGDFTPQNLGNIAVGDTIVWQHVSGSHNVWSANIPAGATAWQSPNFSSGGTFSRTFTVAGNYRYYCEVHSTAAEANLTPQVANDQVGQFTVVADTTAPAAPTGLTATAAGGSQINLAWTVSSSTDVASQQLFRSTTTTKPATPFATIANNTTASYADGGLTAATQYWYWLDAVDGANNRSTSATANATTATVTAQVVAQEIVLFDIPATISLSVTPASINFGLV